MSREILLLVDALAREKSVEKENCFHSIGACISICHKKRVSRGY